LLPFAVNEKQPLFFGLDNPGKTAGQPATTLSAYCTAKYRMQQTVLTNLTTASE
jgi:hypothetical protein